MPELAFKHLIEPAGKHSVMCTAPPFDSVRSGRASGVLLSERTTIMAFTSFFSPPTRPTAFGSTRATITTATAQPTPFSSTEPLARPAAEGRARALNACARCGGRFGMVTYRWWGSKFCKKACKAAFLRELGLGRDEIRRWFGVLRGTPASSSPAPA
jgi:hypothetical protein